MCKARQVQRIGALICGLLWAGSLRADELRLSELEANALRTRPAIRASDARIAQAKARIAQARSAYAPTMMLIADASISPGQQLVPLMLPGGSSYLVGATRPFGDEGAWKPIARYGISLDLRGRIYDFGRTSAAVDSAMAQRRAAQAESRRAADDVVRDVRTAYVRWATSHALWLLAADAVRAAEERAKTTSAAIEEGARPSADRVAAQTDALFAQLELERTSATLETARLDLGVVCVVDLPPDARPQPSVLETGELPKPHDTRDPILTSLEEQRAAARASARVYETAFLPLVTMQAQAGVQGQSISGFPVYRLGLAISVPLWDGGADSAARMQAEGRAAELAAQATEYRQLRDHDRKRAQLARDQAARRIQLADQLIALTRERVAQLEEGYPLGAATLQQLADARAALQRASTELVLAQAMRAEAQLGVH